MFIQPSPISNSQRKSFVPGRRVFPRRLTNGGIFSNRLLFENNGLLFYPIVSGNFCEGDKALMEGDKVVMGDPPVPPLGKTLGRPSLSCTGICTSKKHGASKHT